MKTACAVPLRRIWGRVQFSRRPPAPTAWWATGSAPGPPHKTAIPPGWWGGCAFQRTAAGADCLVGYGIGSSTVVEDAYPYGWGWGWDPYVYREGIIAVDLYDAKSRQPLWHASVEQSLYRLNGAEAEKRIDAAVAAIFTKY